MAIAYVLDEVFAGHRPPSAHPERPERLHAVREALGDAGLPSRGQLVAIREAGADELGRVHRAGYLDDLEREIVGKAGWLDADTYFSRGSWPAALAAAGAAVDLTRGVLDGRFQQGLAVVRPPGHHAEADRAMGFCLFNNAAVAAAAARAAGAARVAILDWDVHHGNGTQHIFEADPTVMYLSCHQYPFYPGTGAPSEIGVGQGAGATVNVGLPAGSDDADYLATFDRVLIPALERFKPDIILLSAGFDAFVADPLAAMRITRAGYRQLADRVVTAARRVCEGRLVCLLEGGYDLRGLAGGVTELFEAMEAPAGAGRQPEPAEPSPAARRAIEATLAAHREVAA